MKTPIEKIDIEGKRIVTITVKIGDEKVFETDGAEVQYVNCVDTLGVVRRNLIYCEGWLSGYLTAEK